MTKTTTTKAAKTQAPAKATKATKEAPATTEASAKDKFGCRLESQAATINAAITTKPKTPATIAEETGLDAARVRAHLKHLLGKQLVVETDEGFKTKK